MANSENLDLKRLDEPKASTNFNHQIYYQNNFDKIDAAMGAKPADLTTTAKTIIPAINELKSDKVDKETGKGLSTNDYTTTEKNKLAGIPADTAAQLAEKVQNFKIKNEVVNGDFSQGMADWSKVGNVLIDNNGVNISSNNAQSYLVKNMPNLSLLNKFYISLKYETLQQSIGNIDFWAYINITTTSRQFFNLNNSPGLYRYSTVATNFNGLFVGTTASNRVFNLKVESLLVIDLTANFGAGNEPTKEQMDKLLSVYPNSWFNGTSEIGSIGALMRASLGGQVVTPTLLNSRTGSAQYVVSNDGLVIFRGTASGGSLNTNIFVLPENIRPIATRTFPISANNAFGVITVAANGEVRQTVGALTNVFLDGIAFKVAVL